ncbi:hypothetical protein CPB84DRAFT_1643939, partial [Gymnopilus junonius]
NNSCAYDSVFTVIFSIWCNNQERWGQYMDETNNNVMKLLSQEFILYEENKKTLEQARDKAQYKLHSVDPTYMPFG